MTSEPSSSRTLDAAVVWRVWLGTYTQPALIVAPPDATLESVAQAAKVALHDHFQREVRPEHEEHDRRFWTDAVAAVDVTKIERGDDVSLHPRIAAVETTTNQKQSRP